MCNTVNTLGGRWRAELLIPIELNGSYVLEILKPWFWSFIPMYICMYRFLALMPIHNDILMTDDWWLMTDEWWMKVDEMGESGWHWMNMDENSTFEFLLGSVSILTAPVYLGFSQQYSFLSIVCHFLTLSRMEWWWWCAIYDCKLRSEKAPFYEYSTAFSTFMNLSPTKESFFMNWQKIHVSLIYENF